MKRKVGPKGQIVIPKEIRDTLGLREGASLVFSLSGDVIELRSEPTAEQILRKFFTVKGKRTRRRVEWRTVLDEEYKVPAGK